MDDQEAPEADGLFKLPPEIRNEIYAYCFQPQHSIDSGSEINLVKANRYHPDPTITGVCHEIRSEALGYYKATVAQFWREHTFFLDIHPESSSQKRQEQRDHILGSIDGLSSRPAPDRLCFKVTWPRANVFSTMAVTASPTSRAQWSSSFMFCPRSAALRRVAESFTAYITRWSETLDHGPRRSAHADAVGHDMTVVLDVEGCVKLFFKFWGTLEGRFDDMPQI